MGVSRIISTDKAAELIVRLKEMHGPLMFHQSGGGGGWLSGGDIGEDGIDDFF